MDRPSVEDRLYDRSIGYRRNLKLPMAEIRKIEAMYDGEVLLDGSPLLIANLDAALWKARAEGFFKCRSCKLPYRYPSDSHACSYCGEPKVGESVILKEDPFKMYVAVQLRPVGQGVIFFNVETKPVGLVLWVQRRIPMHMLYSAVSPHETYRTSFK